MIAVMTGWLSKAFRTVSLSVHYAIGPNQGVFACMFTFLCLYVCLRACTCVLQTYMYVITLMWCLVACDEETYVILSDEIALLIGPRSTATSAAHLTCRNRPQECSLINLNYSFPDSAAPRSVVNPGSWFKSSNLSFVQTASASECLLPNFYQL